MTDIESLTRKETLKPGETSVVGQYRESLTPYGIGIDNDARDAVRQARQLDDHFAIQGPMAAAIFKELRDERRRSSATPPGLRPLR